MRAEESKTYSVLDLTSRLFAPLFYQFVRPKLVALFAKLGKVFLGFSESLGPSPQDELLLVQTPDYHRALLKFQMFAYLGREQDPSRPIQLNGELFHTANFNKSGRFRGSARFLINPGCRDAQYPTVGTSYRDGCAPVLAPLRYPSSCNCSSSARPR